MQGGGFIVHSTINIRTNALAIRTGKWMTTVHTHPGWTLLQSDLQPLIL
jgi:hypothetical protein